MKKILITCLGIILISCSTNSKNKFKCYKLHYNNSSGERGVTTFDYNDKGQIQVAVWELLNGDRFSINFYKYDLNGNQIEKYREFSDSLTSTQHFYYNDRSQLIKETYERSDGRKGEVNYIYQNNKKIKAECNGLNGWFYGSILYQHTNQDKPTNAIIEQKEQKTGTIEYTYNSNGQIEREHWDFSGQWSQTFTYEYGDYSEAPKTYTSSNVFYANSNYQLNHEDYTFNNEAGGPSLFKYDNQGKLIKKQFIRSDSLTTTTYYLYNDGGILNRSIRLYSTGKMGLFRYMFNDFSKLIQREMIISDGLRGSEKYVYNENGQLVSARYDKMDTWLTGDITFNYKDDIIYSALFKGQNGFDAEISFEWNQNKNPIQIKWDFTFGKFQQYKFKYKH